MAIHTPQTEVILHHDGAELARVTLPPGEYIIGRGSEANICADTPLLSRKHALLTINYDHLLIEDLGSSNGTFVANQPVAECTRLYPTQAVRLGDVQVEFHRLPAPSDPDASLPPAQAAIRKLVPEEVLAERRYAIGTQIARGGMGAILQAQQNAMKRRVAMKVMLESSEAGDVARFVDEAQITGQLEHPNIVPVHELGVDEQGQLFYTMKLVRGITLKKVLELLAEGVPETVKKFTLPALLTTFQKACDAIAFAHAKRVIHRDLKPENIMLGDFGEVLVMDWGLAKDISRAGAGVLDPGAAVSDRGHNRSAIVSARTGLGDTSRTLSGTIMGTPQYMPPEQARGEVEALDARTDIYSLGAILYHILHLRPPVTGGDAWEIVEKVKRGEIDWSVPKRPAPPSLLAVCRKALAMDPAQRYASVEDLQADVIAYQNGFATRAEKAGTWKQITLLIKRHQAASIGIAAVLILGSALGTKAVIEGRRAEAALRDLRGTAPAFQAQAVALLNDGKFDDALAKIGFAIKLDDSNADYRLFRANLLEASQRLTEAATEYREVLRLRPGDKASAENLALCESLLHENGADAPLSRAVQLKLLAALRQQKRLVEAGPLNALVEPDIATAEAALRARLRSYAKQPGWNSQRVKRLNDGTFSVDLGGLALGDLSLLHGQPFTILNLSQTDLADLRPLAGLPLKMLNIRETAVGDLSPLKGMPLESLTIERCKNVADLKSLSGLPLHFLNIQNTNVTDLGPLKNLPLDTLVAATPKLHSLEPLRGMPLRNLEVRSQLVDDLTPLSECRAMESLDISMTSVRDLSPLAHLPLKILNADRTNIDSIEPLRGVPLEFLAIDRTKVTDLSPLLGCPGLRDLVIPDTAKNIEVLHKLPSLQRLSRKTVTHLVPAQSVAEFWAEYDAQQAAGKK